MDIRYHIEDGSIKFSYSETENISEYAYRVYRAEGLVPAEIVEKGAKAISAHAEAEVAKQIKEQKDRIALYAEKTKNINQPIEIQYRKTKIKGRIVSGYHGVLVVKMESPLQAIKSLRFGFASAMACRTIVDSDFNLTEYAYKKARDMLQAMFDEAVTADPQMDALLDELNS